ncbi:MAG TPA: Uma2 family endonuclease [Candidatus Acidoferrales bacterium]|jgi:Uma2 family endonuclease|nr:Uma2 family endonuclease [Candidatus Acidoferrales bacterium]
MSMGTIVRVSEEEYLGTAYEPDCEFEDGVLIERNLGQQDHSWLQTALAAYFFRRRRLWGIEAFTGQRHRIRAEKYMLPDVCVIKQPRPAERVFSRPPLIWIEILFPADRPLKVNDKVRQAIEFGVPNVWVIDPETLDAETHAPTGSRKVEDRILRVPDSPISVPLDGLDV